jgi:uncharacterized protein with PQ loop repeat
MTWFINRPGNQYNIIHPSNVQRQKLLQPEVSLKYFIVKLLTYSTLLFMVVIKTLTEYQFTLERNPYTPTIICNYIKILLCLTETYNIIIAFKFTPAKTNGEFSVLY